MIGGGNMNQEGTFLTEKRAIYWGPVLAGAISFVMYLLTAFRTITWWDSGEYSLAAITLGVPHPPGSVVATIIGWIASRIPFGIPPIFVLNLLAGFLAALTAGITCYLALLLLKDTVFKQHGTLPGGSLLVYLFVAAGTLALPLGETLWLYAIKFTPYVFTALFTALILWGMWRWWEKAGSNNALPWLFLITFLFGLDFSVHRTNLLLLPGFIIWILLHRPGILRSGKAWWYGISGMVVGLSFQLLLIPMAARRPFLNMNDPGTLTALWDYVTLKMYGGGWLLNLFPRKAPLLQYQVPDFLKVFADNFLSTRGALGILGVIPALLGLVGIIGLWQRNRRAAIGLLVLFLCASAGAIFYFNIPPNFFRSMDRHYLPALVIFTVWIGYGTGFLINLLWGLASKYRYALSGLAGILIIMIPFSQINRNYRAIDSSRNYFTHDFAVNILSTLPSNAIFIAGGDNDTWPLWYFQAAEKMRPDVTLLNINLLNTAWFLRHVIAQDKSLPLTYTEQEISDLNMLAWADSTVAIPIDDSAADFCLPNDIILPDSVHLNISPTVAGKYILIQDQVLLQLIMQNRWRRPIYFSSGVSDERIPWLSKYLRMEGLARRLLPVENPPLNIEILRTNLLEKYWYRGYADTTMPLEMATKWTGLNLCAAFIYLATDQLQRGNATACKETILKMNELLHPERLDIPPPLQQARESLCL
jgi:Protein O-mannosyl-transferase TMEM260-like